MTTMLKTYAVHCHEAARPGRKVTVTVAAVNRGEAVDAAWNTYSDIDLIVDRVKRLSAIKL